MNESYKISLPDIIKDPTAEGGIAPLKARYFQRSWELPPIVECCDVEIPDRWLLSLWIKRQEAQAHNPNKVNSVWREFSQLPTDYRFAINKHLNELVGYDREVRRDVGDTWIILHLECMFEKRRRRMFNSGGRKKLVGVYVVIKQEKKSRYSGADEIIIRRESSDSRTRQRSGKNGYEPRHSRVVSREESSRTRDRRSTRESNRSVRRSSREDYYSGHRPREDYYYERRPRESYYSERSEPEIRQEIEKLELERSIIREENERMRDQILLSRSNTRSPQQMPFSRQRMNDGSDLMHPTKFVSFARTPSFTDENRRKRERERNSAPSSGFTVPIIDPDSLSPRPDSPPYDLNLSQDRRRSNHRRTRSRSRSASPRPLRRIYTGKYFSIAI